MTAANGIPVIDLVIALRGALGLDPEQPPPAVDVLPPMPLDFVVRDVDLHAWISWAVGCLPLFAGEWPTAQWARKELFRLLVSVTMVRAKGRIARASALLDTSRSRLRATLREMESEPWPPDRGTASANQAGPTEDGTSGRATITRGLPVVEVAAFLRFLVGLMPAADESRLAIPAVDVEVWIAWVFAGLRACALPRDTEGKDTDEAKEHRRWMPPMDVLVAEARTVAIVIAMRRHGGNITHAAESLKTSRRALREALKRFKIYPWGVAAKDDDASDDDESAEAGRA